MYAPVVHSNSSRFSIYNIVEYKIVMNMEELMQVHKGKLYHVTRSFQRKTFKSIARLNNRMPFYQCMFLKNLQNLHIFLNFLTIARYC